MSTKFILLLVFFTNSLLADSIIGRVIKVSDGDTITILDSLKKQHKVRLIGIDAPEKRQAFGKVSKTHLSTLIFGKNVRVEYKKNDRYGRILGKVIYNGKDINLEQIKAGLAWHYKRFEKEQYVDDRKIYSDSELEAKAKKLGIWSMKNIVPPWEFRREIARK